MNEELQRLVALGAQALREPGGSRRVGIAGAVGDALFACALRQYGSSIDPHAWLSRAVEAMRWRGANASLHGGLAGLGLTVALYTDEEDLLRDIDRRLLEQLSGMAHLSVQNGVAGVGLYASLRTQAPSGMRLQGAVLERLKAEAIPLDAGVTWHSTGAYVRARGLDFPGERAIEYGLLHGVAGVLTALAALARQGHDDGAALARDAIRFLWARELSTVNRFGRIDLGAYGDNGSIDLGTGRWCVGDVGTLYAIWLASNPGDAASKRALATLRGLARDHATTPADRWSRLDLCCGAGAIAQVYRRLYWATGDGLFDAANRRLATACALGVEDMAADDFAYGSKGALLAALAASSDTQVHWDAILGLSLPSRKGPVA